MMRTIPRSGFPDHPRVVIDFPEDEAESVSKTKQSHKDECDVNKILARYTKSGMLTHLKKGVPTFLDVSEVGDFRAVMAKVHDTEVFFAGLSSEVRAKFGNDVPSFLDWVADPANREEAGKLGLIEVEEKPAVPATPAPATP